MKNITRSKYMSVLLFAIFITAMPILLRSPYFSSFMVIIGLYAIVTMGLILLMGYAGQLSLGQAAFYGMGAYTTGILTTQYHLPPWLVLFIATFLAGSLAAIIGRPILKLPGYTLAIVTLALNMIFSCLLINLSELTGGTLGLGNIPHLSLGSFLLKTDFHYYYLVWIIALIFLVFSLNLINSRTGRALRAMHPFAGGSEEVAQTLGIDTTKYKVQIFSLSAVYASVAGSIYAHYTTYIDPPPFNFLFSILVMMMAVVGGLRSPWGAFLGAGLFIGLRELMSEFMPRLVGGPTGPYEVVIFGVILVLVLLFLPQGLILTRQRIFSTLFSTFAKREGKGLWNNLSWS